MIAFGKGNGSVTISNLKNKGPKGPIKEIAKHLGNLCVVILTDEYNTSQICSRCKEEKVIHPKITGKKKVTTKDKITNKKIVEYKEACYESHTLCYCNCKHNIDLQTMEDFHKVWWNRDYNASRNILNVMTNKLLGRKLGKFSRRIKDKSIKNNTWSLDQGTSKNDCQH